MKINEILVESQQTDEAAPFGTASRLWAKTKAAMPTFLGGTAQQAQSDIRVGDRANKLSQAFNKYALDAFGGLDNVPLKNIKMWVEKNKIPFVLSPELKGMNAVNLKDPSMSKALWYGIARNEFKTVAGQPSGVSAMGTYDTGAKKKPAPAAAPAPEPAPVPPAPPSPPPGPIDYNQLARELGATASRLTPRQKAQLIRMLS